MGIAVLRFYDEDVMRNIEGVLRMIWRFIVDFEEKQKKHPLLKSPLTREDFCPPLYQEGLGVCCRFLY